MKILLDVDGVLNRLSDRKILPEGWTEHELVDKGKTYSVALNASHGEMLLDWANSMRAEHGDTELVWCTMWENTANLEIGPLIGLPRLLVAPIARKFSDYDVGVIKARSAVQFMDEHFPGEDWVFLDDEPNVEECVSEMMAEDHRSINWMVMQIDPMVGLSQEYLDIISYAVENWSTNGGSLRVASGRRHH